jgi:hypothetical protein
MKNLESIPNGAVNNFEQSSFIFQEEKPPYMLRAFGNCAKGILPGLARVQQDFLRLFQLQWGAEV